MLKNTIVLQYVLHKRFVTCLLRVAMLIKILFFVTGFVTGCNMIFCYGFVTDSISFFVTVFVTGSPNKGLCQTGILKSHINSIQNSNFVFFYF